MSHQIIKQPNGKYAIYSSVTDSVIIYEMSKKELVEYYKEEAANKAETDVLKMIKKVNTRTKPYYQFTKTWDEVKHTIPL